MNKETGSGYIRKRISDSKSYKKDKSLVLTYLQLQFCLQFCMKYDEELVLSFDTTIFSFNQVSDFSLAGGMKEAAKMCIKQSLKLI